MNDFPEKIWLANDDDELTRHAPVYDFWYTSKPDFTEVISEYIRSDLVPQWQPIETVPINTPVLAVVRREPEYGRVHIVGSSSQDKLKLEYSHWMPIPKDPT